MAKVELESYRYLNGHYMFSLDGTGQFSSEKVHGTVVFRLAYYLSGNRCPFVKKLDAIVERRYSGCLLRIVRVITSYCHTQVVTPRILGYLTTSIRDEYVELTQKNKDK
jgi:hypothetical protein